jgi:large subunit ribosomal protein L15
MQSNTLKPTHARITTPRVGRGGKRGKTSGRGTKGQNARAGHKNRPEIRDQIKKIPKMRGHGKNRSRSIRGNSTVKSLYTPVNLAALELAFNSGDAVTLATLTHKGITSTRGGRVQKVKILGMGTLTKKLDLSGIPTSGSAKAAIEAVGGSVL